MESLYEAVKNIDYKKEPKDQLDKLQVFDSFSDEQINDFLDKNQFAFRRETWVIVRHWGYSKVKHKIPFLLSFLRTEENKQLSEALIPMGACIVPEIKSILETGTDYRWHYYIIHCIAQKWDKATIEQLKQTLIDSTINAADEEGASVVALETIRDIIPAEEFKKYKDYLFKKYTENNQAEMLEFLQEVINNPGKKLESSIQDLLDKIDCKKKPEEQLEQLSAFDNLNFKQVLSLMRGEQTMEKGIVIRYLGYNKLQYRIPDLLVFIIDLNWAGADDVAKALVEMGEKVVPTIKSFLQTPAQDEEETTWELSILTAVVQHLNKEVILQLKQELVDFIYSTTHINSAIEALAALKDIILKEEFVQHYRYLINLCEKEGNSYMLYVLKNRFESFS